jgi:hypothetical protein
MIEESNTWSEELQQHTRDFISDRLVSPHDGRLHFKSADGHFGIIAFEHLSLGKLILKEKESGQVLEFACADALISAGWVID